MKRELDKQCGPDILKPNVIVGVFLVREGANIHAVNQMGVHPLYVHPPDVAQLVTSYAAGVNTKSVLKLTTPLSIYCSSVHYVYMSETLYVHVYSITK